MLCSPMRTCAAVAKWAAIGGSKAGCCAKRTTFDDFVDVADALAHDGALGLVDGRRIVSRGLSAGDCCGERCRSVRTVGGRWSPKSRSSMS